MNKKTMLGGLLLLSALSLAGCYGATLGSSSSSEGDDPSSESASSEAGSSEEVGSSESTGSEASESSDSSSSSSNPPSATSIVTGWERNAAYVKYEVAKSSPNADLGGNDFVSGNGKFRIGTANALSFCPRVTYLDLISQDVEVRETVPEGTSITLTSGDTTLTVGDYITSDSLSSFLSKGTLKFRSDIDATLPRDIRLTMGNASSNLSDHVYDIRIEDGAFNVTEEKQLVLFDNTHTHESYLEIKRDYFGVDASASTTYDKIVIQKDLTIEAGDLPSFLIWSEADAKAPSSVYGSLKDWEGIYQKEAVNGGLYAVYGNYNQISLGETFPYAISEARASGTPTFPGEDAEPISTHAFLFGGEATTLSPEVDFEYRYEDLAVHGNQGVAADQLIDWNGTPNDKTDDINGGGVLFSKGGGRTVIENCWINSFFTVYVNNGPSNVSEVTRRAGHRPTLTVNNSRVNDIFSSMFFNYSDSVINVNDSVVENSGGFLFINQAIPTEADTSISDYSKWADLDKSLVMGSDVIVDADTKLQNWVTGEGGWFDLYGLGGLFQTALKPVFSDTLNPYGKTLFKTVNGALRTNAIGVMMNCDMESAGELEPGMKGCIQVGDTVLVNSSDATEISNWNTALAAASTTGDMTALMGLMTTEEYASGFLHGYTTAGLYIPDSDYFLSPYLVNDQYVMITNEQLITYLTTALGGGQPSTEGFGLDRTKLTGDYATISYVFGEQPATPSGKQGLMDDLAAYKGSGAYKVIFGLDNAD